MTENLSWVEGVEGGGKCGKGGGRQVQSREEGSLEAFDAEVVCEADCVYMAILRSVALGVSGWGPRGVPRRCRLALEW